MVYDSPIMVKNATFFCKGAADSPQTSTNKMTPSRRSVFLSDWWLVDTKDNDGGRKLAVGGKNYNRLNMVREFTSAFICKRVDAFTLETIDGFTIVIDGPVNQNRSKLNGFSVEVCSQFLMGFPVNWETYTVDFFPKESISEFANSSGGNILHRPSSIPQDGSPASKIAAFIKLAEYDIYQRSRKRERENCDTCIGNTVKIELNDGSVSPTSELNFPRSTRLMKIEKIETPTGNEIHLQTPLDSPVSCDKLQFSSEPKRKRGRPSKTGNEIHLQTSLDSPVSCDKLQFSSEPKRKRGRPSKAGNEIHLQNPLDSPVSCDKLQFFSKPKRKRGRPSKASKLSNHSSKEGCGQKFKKAKELDSPDQGQFTRDRDPSLFSSPELLNLRRSRSGRLLVPMLDVQQRLIHDGDGSIIGIMKSYQNEDPPSSSRTGNQ
ncbi:hypothetical protein ZOSMA_30G00570 [Zostera marina]|uniref:SANTA domain-containing protein n=1 Tax=Zostera marina TaxID=29655 RepID=A0A0K9PC05_ZOSMR|nr:hypothetical protein ZOSMA_30G00570 [Zostera marina]